MIEFAHPEVLWIGGPVYLLWAAAWLARAYRGAPRAALRYSSLQTFAIPSARGAEIFRFVARALRLVAVGLLLIALARPRIDRSEVQVFSEGIDIMLAVDTSGSMNALDLDPGRPIRERRNRLEVVKDVLARFIEQRPADQIGMVAFGAWSFTQCPLTLDHDILKRFLAELEIGVAGRSTAIGDALGIAVKRLRESKAQSKVVILLTDGRNNSGKLDPQKAAEIAKSFGIRVYAVGAGTRGSAPVIDVGILGPRVSSIEATIDDEALTQLAETTGGSYFRAEDRRGLAEVYEQIDTLEKSSIEGPDLRRYDERYPSFLLAAVILLALELGALATRLRSIP
ncbi:MAG: VWA domain-containing protein [Myxococcota bacterium]